MCVQFRECFFLAANIFKHPFRFLDYKFSGFWLNIPNEYMPWTFYRIIYKRKRVWIMFSNEKKINELTHPEQDFRKIFFSHFHEPHKFNWIKYSLIKRGQQDNLVRNNENFINFLFYQNTVRHSVCAHMCSELKWCLTGVHF